MTKLNRIDIIEDIKEKQEEKENLELELYYFKQSIGDREPTYDELKQEVEYRKNISNKQYELDCLKDEGKLIMLVRTGLYVLGLLAALTAILACKNCSKDTNTEAYTSTETSIVEEYDNEDAKVLVKTLK